MNTFDWLAFLYQLIGLLAIMLVDLIAGISLAVSKRKFEIKKVFDFLLKAFPLLILWFGAEVLGFFLPHEAAQNFGLESFAFLGRAVYILIMLKYALDFFAKLNAVGILPKVLRRDALTDNKYKEG
jgi:hypothetical protein